MKTVKLFIIASLGLFALASCSKDGADYNTNSITVKAAIGNITKVSYSGNASAFEAGDNLSLFGWVGDKASIPSKLVVDGVVNTMEQSGKWQPATQMLWKNTTTPHYFMAVSPAREVKSFTADEYVLDPAADKYQQSDLLIAVNDKGLKASNNPVELVFEHAMATLVVKLSFRNQWTEGNPPSQTVITEAKIAAVEATAKDHASIDYIDKAVSATGEAVQVALNKVENSQWTGLMVPQEGFRTITISLAGNDEWLGGNGTYIFTAAEDIALESGKVTTVNLIIGRDQITLAENGITISDWVAQESETNGEVFKPVQNN